MSGTLPSVPDQTLLSTLRGRLEAEVERLRGQIEILEPGGVLSYDDGFADSGAEAAVICAASEPALKDARSLAPRLRELGARLVLLAAAPGETVPDVDALLHEGADLLAVLARTHRVLGVST